MGDSRADAAQAEVKAAEIIGNLSEEPRLGEGQLQEFSTSHLVPLYNRYDGLVSHIPSDQLRQRLGQRFAREHPWAGQLVYTQEKMEPVRGSGYLCVLHPDSARRAEFDALGFKGVLCRKATLPTEREVELHLQAKHRGAFKAREKADGREQREQQMDLLRQQTALMEAQVAAANAEPRRGRPPKVAVLEEKD